MLPTMVTPDLAGGVTESIQTWGTLNGLLINVIGTLDFPHNPEISDLCDEISHMIEGSPWFSINGIPVCRMGDHSDCGHAAVASQLWFEIS